jgi:hypothetical protein
MRAQSTNECTRRGAQIRHVRAAGSALEKVPVTLVAGPRYERISDLPVDPGYPSPSGGPYVLGRLGPVGCVDR